MTAKTVSERRFTASEFEHMCRSGVFGPDENVELIHGRILSMPPQGPLHAATVQRLLLLLVRCGVPLEALLIERPLNLGPSDQPIPDLAIVEPDPTGNQYAAGHPTPDRILLAVEVADSSLQFDLGDKALRYAAAGVPEYWVVDLRTRVLHRLSEPAREGYQQASVLFGNEMVSLPAATELSGSLQVRQLFPELPR
jgi:Uma2 family endonuclease